ncbi:MAG: hypothetical protein CL807_01730 [Citromicrobium sp.]|nr:hypothetical protein [Citromicrobium sp.]MAO97230.1 hypothetical protein [Citromicrobium sp.]MBD75619.1 hypothetical protein [Citromicrobium sp.]MBT45729.1 hypothetical protein [Citromicrobium sp.]|tara:strand:- start:22572 stop:24695 length:2124 start_codon:yes stop_codon:yes gene_type:complete
MDFAPSQHHSNEAETTAETGHGTGGLTDLIDPQRLAQRAFELRYWLLGIVAAAVTLAILATVLQDPQYLASSRIEISRVDAGATQIEGVAIDVEDRDRQYYETQYVLLRSRFLAERVVEAENLTQDRAAIEALGYPETASPSAEQLARNLLGHVQVEPIPQSNLVDISVRSGGAATSSKLANAWAEQFIRANYDKRFGDTQDARRRLERQLAEQRERLEISEAALISYANENGIVVLQRGASGDSEGGGQQTLVETRLSQLNEALAEATARRIEAEGASRAASVANAGAATIRSRIAEVEATLARLRTTLGPENSQVEASEAELRSLRSALSKESGITGAASDAQLRGARQVEAELQARFDRAKAEYLAQQNQGVQYGILDREVNTNRQLYDALLQRYKELDVVGGGRNNIALVERAEQPGGPYSPSLVRNLFLALLVALGLCGGLVFAREIFDDTVRDPSELRRRLGLPVLGLIPKFEADEVENQLGDTHSELSEAYASTRVAINFATKPDDKIILVTSTRPDEGKSLTSLAIAYNFARLKKKVLLVDMDLRRKGISIRLNESKSTEGMSTYLAGQISSLPTVHKDEFGLDFVRAGTSTLNPADILSTSQFQIVLDELRKHYDWIVLDAPPLLGLADTPQIADAVDAIVYVVQANGSTFRSVRQAVQRLRASHGKLLGAVVTKLDYRNESYAYGYKYGYGYDYKSE